MFAGYIVGWRVSSSMETTFVLMHWSRRYGPVDRPARSITVIKVLQYVSLALHTAAYKPDYWHQQGSTGDSYDNAMAESINGLYKAEVIHRKSWKTVQKWNWPH